MSLMSISTWAQNFKDEAGNYYQVTDKENLKVELLTAASNISSVTIDKKSVRGKVKYDDKIYTITKIGNFAFANATIPDSVDIPETVTELGYYALKNQTLRFADKTLKHLTSIGEYAFDGTTVTQLGTEIDFSAVCKLLPKGAFHNAKFAYDAVINMGKVTKLEDEIFGADEPTYDIKAIVFSHAGMEDVLTEVGVGALKWRGGLTNFGYVDNGTYFLPKTLKTIGDFAFYYCNNLNKIQFSAYAEGARITEVGEYAFQYCYMDDATFKNLFKSFEGLTYSKGSFYGCSLTNIDLEKSDIKEIPEDAFNGNYNLTKLTLPAGCTKIGKNAFKDNSIAKITLPEGLVTVEEGGLLSAIPWGDENIFSQDELCLPKSLKSIGEDGIGNRKINQIFVNPKFNVGDVPTLDEQTNLTVDATYVPVVPAWVDNKVTKTSKSVYDAKGWPNVQYVSVLNTIGGIEYNDIVYGNAGAADESTGLIPIKVTNYKAAEPTVNGLLRTTSKKGSYTYNLYFKVDGFAETVTAQGNDKKAVKVTKITFSPKASFDGIEVTGYTAIPAGALANCMDLTAVALGDGIEEVGASAFANTKITEVTLPASLKTIGESAFATQTLKKVNVSYAAKNLFAIPEDAFYAKDSTFTALLNVTEATREDYLLQNGWKLFFDNTFTVNVTKNEEKAKEIRIATIDDQKGARIYQLKDAGDIAKVSVTGVPEKGAPKVQYIRDFKNTNFQAWYVPFDYTYTGSEDFKFYYIYDTKQSDFTADGTTSIELKEVAVGKQGTVIKANTPYVIQATAAKELTFEADAIQNTVGENKITVGNVQNQFTFTGIYARKTGVEKEEADWYALSGGKLDNYKGKTNLGVNAYRFYMTYKGQTNPYGLVKFVVLDDEDATAIENVKANSLNAPMFDLMGRQIAAPAKGQVYIQNGVKKLAK